MTVTEARLSTLDFPALRDASRPIHRIAERLEPYLRVLVERIKPEKVILFGSYAYGEPDEHSDVDLLVIRRGITSESRATWKSAGRFGNRLVQASHSRCSARRPRGSPTGWRSTVPFTRRSSARDLSSMQRKISNQPRLPRVRLTEL